MANITKYKDFLENNREALELLSEKVKGINTVAGIDSIEEAKGRQYAINIIDEWLNDLWSITTEVLPELEEDDELYKIVD